MLTERENRASRRLLAEGMRFQWSPHSYIAESSNWLHSSREMHEERVNTFTAIVGEINERTDFSGAYRDVGLLKQLTGNTLLPTLGDIVANCEDDALAREALEDAKADFPAWANTRFASKGSAIWGMVIEGYGLYLGKRFGGGDEEKITTIRRTFVQVFEAVAFIEHRESGLVTDVIDWMREESDSFPPEIATQLR